MPKRLGLSPGDLIELLNRLGFKEIRRVGDTVALRNLKTGRLFSFCAAANAKAGRVLLLRLLLDLDLIDPVRSIRVLAAADEDRPLLEQLAELEGSIVRKAMRRYGNVSQAAKALGLSRPALYERLKRHHCANPRGLKEKVA